MVIIFKIQSTGDERQEDITGWIALWFRLGKNSLAVAGYTRQFLTFRAIQYCCQWLLFFLKRELSWLSTTTAFAYWTSISHNLRRRNQNNDGLIERFLLVSSSTWWLLLSNTLSTLWIIINLFDKAATFCSFLHFRSSKIDTEFM